MHVLYGRRMDLGWHPVNYMVEMAVKLFDADLTVVGQGETLLQSIGYRAGAIGGAVSGMTSRRRGSEPCLVICPTPRDLASLMQIKKWRSRFGTVVAWVIDSHLVERILWCVRVAGPFDHVFVSRREDIELWRGLVKCSVTYLPRGCDALGLGSSSAERPVDLQRIGRQPQEWDNDEVTERECRRVGLSFAGRPPMHSSPLENQRTVMECYARAKYVLAFSNTAHSTPYIHPTRPFLSERWSDALACGASVAGIPPDVSCVRDVLWPEALLPFSTVSRSEGLQVLSAAVRAWDPGLAQLNHMNSLKRLDWRHRFKTIADNLEISFPRLEADLEQVARKIEGTTLGDISQIGGSS